jgi:hypothetical protein
MQGVPDTNLNVSPAYQNNGHRKASFLSDGPLFLSEIPKAVSYFHCFPSAWSRNSISSVQNASFEDTMEGNFAGRCA